MAKIPFSIDYRSQVESGEYKVETRDGRKVRVLCYDANNITPIVALVTFNDGSESSYDYYPNGSIRVHDRDNPLDLFIVTPEPELTEFEKAVKDLCWKVGMGEVVYKDDIIKKIAAELLELARKEIMDGWSKGLNDTQSFSGKAYYDGYNLGFEIGYEQGKAVVLKDLPRWKKVGSGHNYSSETKFAIYGRYLEMNDTLNDLYEISLSELEKLPK